MEDKYYIPEITEFHVGFEYEIRVELGKDNWSKQSFNDTFLQLFYPKEFESIDSEIRNNNIRVKYLDQEDIASLGFKIKDYHEDSLMPIYTKGTYHMMIDSSGAWLITHDDKTRTPDEKGKYKQYPIFRGFIKNKSELKKKY